MGPAMLTAQVLLRTANALALPRNLRLIYFVLGAYGQEDNTLVSLSFSALARALGGSTKASLQSALEALSEYGAICKYRTMAPSHFSCYVQIANLGAPVVSSEPEDATAELPL